MLDNLILLEITATLVVLLATLVSMRLMREHEEKQLQKCALCKEYLKPIVKVEKRRAKAQVKKAPKRRKK